MQDSTYQELCHIQSELSNTNKELINRMVWTIIGASAAVLTMFGFVPQVIKMLRTKHVDDVSLISIIQFAIGVSLWTLYGIHLRDTIIIVANLVSLITLLTAITLYFLYSRKVRVF